MLLAHYADATSDRDPGWLQALDNAADGRAAPLFATLLGVGAGILSARGTPDRVLVRRGLALFVLGMAIWPITDDVYLILPHYGVVLALVPLLRRLPTRGLIVGALVCFALPSVIHTIAGDTAMRDALQPDEYSELVDLPEIARQLVWTGGYPLVGWTGFALVGLWLARLPLSQVGTQRRLLVGGIALCAVQPIAAAIAPAEPHGVETFVDSTAHSNQFAWYVSATGSACALIALCLMLAPRFAGLLRPVARLGAMALSAYLLHLLLGAHVVWPWEDEVEPSLAAQLIVVVIVFGTFAIAADAWSRKFARGPVESLLRAISR